MKQTLRSLTVLATACIALASHADIVTTAGDTTAGPVFNRALENFSALSAVGTAVRYDAYSFSVDMNGIYTFLSTARFDNFVFLYSPSFNSVGPLTNGAAANDDLLGLTTSGLQYDLVVGVNYTLVTTGFESTDFGAFSTTIGGAGTITAAAPAAPAAAMPGISTYTGDTTSGSTFNRALEGFSGLSVVGTGVRYDSHRFRVDASGSYTFLSTAAFDNFVFLYAPSLDPTNALAAGQAADDDLLGLTTAGFAFDLVAGVDYEFVTTGFENSDFGAFSNTIAGPGAIIMSTTAVPESQTYALMLMGLAALGIARRRFQASTT